MFQTPDFPKLKKIQCTDLLDLALFVPKGYDNLFLSDSLEAGFEHVLELSIRHVSKQRKFLKITAFSERFDQFIEILYFRFSPYHVKQFHEAESLVLKGKLDRKAGHWQLIQPKILTAINTIEPKYATRALRHSTIEGIKAKYLTEESLLQEGLPEAVASALLTLHFPAPEFAREFSRLGGFPQAQIRALKFTEMFGYFRRLSGKKRAFPARKKLKGNVDSFISSLPFTLTDDQQKALSDIQKDLAQETAARRMIVGDVGCGKTMVILGAVMMAYPDKAVLMAPTTVLARQLYEEARKFLPETVQCALVTSDSGDPGLLELDFLIGTHALLYADLPEVPLVMVDEQHRFGTTQRAQLEKLVSKDENRPHMLQFSATPIPRTQAMIESSLIDISFIRQTPFEKDIDTAIIGKAQFKRLMAHLHAEIGKGHQAIVVYPLVEESENFGYASLEESVAFWQKHFEGVFVTHGKDKEKEAVLAAFREEGSLLLSTTVIEVGISLPRLSTIVIAAPERMGLATLHQLRGRVSRNGLKGYCYLYTNTPDNERLKAFIDTKSGFEIAELDLKFRESGDLLSGTIQSGRQFRWIDLATDTEIVAEVKSLLFPNRSM